MATRSLIGIVKEDKTVQVIYCHWDGYPEYVGLQLMFNYNSTEAVEKLIALGDRSSLTGAPDYENTYASKDGSPVKVWTYDSMQKFYEADKSGTEFVYIYDNQWTVYKAYADNDLEKLGQISEIKLEYVKGIND